MSREKIAFNYKKCPFEGNKYKNLCTLGNIKLNAIVHITAFN